MSNRLAVLLLAAAVCAAAAPVQAQFNPTGSGMVSPPRVEIPPRFVTDSDNAVITGTALPNERNQIPEITVNGIRVPTDANGRFTTTVDAPPGVSEAKIVAYNQNGMNATVTVTIVNRASASRSASPAQPAALAPTGPPRIPLAVLWDGIDSPLSGTMTVSSDEGGRLAFTIPRDGATCSGMWSKSSGGASGVSRGTWAAACSNGQSATGTYESAGTQSGSGRGTDANGRTVRMSFGR
ncbi:MAG: hypothetical protein FJX61_03440 [Alphaproteobacteria bacterium]|nr:hypothetical protein [Alphaproteobacteria bacterium]